MTDTPIVIEKKKKKQMKEGTTTTKSSDIRSSIKKGKGVKKNKRHQRHNEKKNHKTKKNKKKATASRMNSLSSTDSTVSLSYLSSYSASSSSSLSLEKDDEERGVMEHSIEDINELSTKKNQRVVAVDPPATTSVNVDASSPSKKRRKSKMTQQKHKNKNRAKELDSSSKSKHGKSSTEKHTDTRNNKNNNNNNKYVSFDVIHVDEYEHVLGPDYLVTKLGPPISIAIRPFKSTTYTIDEYEELLLHQRQQQQKQKQQHGGLLDVWTARERIVLLQQLGYTQDEIQHAVNKSEIVRDQRKRSVLNQQYDGVAYRTELIKRKVRKILPSFRIQ